MRHATGSGRRRLVASAPVNHYEVLGVPMGADAVEIRRAYLALARRHHPDKHSASTPARQAEARRLMSEANAAWAVLGDPDRRRRYDLDVRRGDPLDRTSPVGRDGRVRAPAGEARRGWSPRADDTGWMDDFEAWRDEVDDLPPDPPAPGGAHAPWKLLPIGVFVASVALGCFALVATIRTLLATAYVGVALSAVLFFAVPLLEMTRRRRDGD